MENLELHPENSVKIEEIILGNPGRFPGFPG